MRLEQFSKHSSEVLNKHLDEIEYCTFSFFNNDALFTNCHLTHNFLVRYYNPYLIARNARVNTLYKQQLSIALRQFGPEAL